ncbi:MAG: MFS transporter [Synergistales bacterium]|nr:MFS transporter [Synergistales bacterium]
MAGLSKGKQALKPELLLLACTHLVNDIHAAFLPTLLPRLVDSLGITLAQGGLLKSMNGLVHIIGQPVFGHYADASRKPFFIVLGPICTALGLALLPFAPNYGAALLCIAIYSIGSAAFHPQGTGTVGLVVPPEQLAFSLAIFSTGGMLGATLSPLYAIAITETLGLSGLPVILLPPLILLGLFFRFRLDRGISSEKPQSTGVRLLPNVVSVFRQVYRIWSISLARNAANQGIRFFLPTLVASRGGSLFEGGATLFAVTITGTAASILGGKVADRLGKRAFLGLSLTAAPLFILPATLAEGAGSTLLFMGAIACLNATIPVTTALAQERVPHARSLSSSMVMGVAFGLAGFVTYPMGLIADRWSVTLAIQAITFLPWLSLIPLAFSARDHSF